MIECLNRFRQSREKLLFYCATLLYFWFIGGVFRRWLPWAWVQEKWGVAVAAVVFLLLLFWFLKRITPGQTFEVRAVLIGYWLSFWLMFFFISRFDLALLWPILWLAFLFWQTKEATSYPAKPDPAPPGNLQPSALVTIALFVIDFYSFATFFNTPIWLLAALSGMLFGAVSLVDRPSLTSLLAAVFLGIQAFWISRFFPWSVAGMTGFLLLMLVWLMAARLIQRWSWFLNGVFVVCLGIMMFGMRWF